MSPSEPAERVELGARRVVELAGFGELVLSLKATQRRGGLGSDLAALVAAGEPEVAQPPLRAGDAVARIEPADLDRERQRLRERRRARPQDELAVQLRRRDVLLQAPVGVGAAFAHDFSDAE